MNYFRYKAGELHAEDVPLRVLAKKYGTPLYVYSASTLERHVKAYHRAFKDIPHIICFAVKASSNIAVLNVLKESGAGADVVSGGELFRALRAGMDPRKVVYAGVGKTQEGAHRASRESGHRP
jgi:diaminopimelate decarboxylase